MQKRFTILVLLIFFICLHGYGQNPDSLRHVKVIGRAKEKSIMLRWATTDPVSWKLANKYGYIVERYTITREKEILPIPEKIVLTKEPLKPKPEQAWLKTFDTDDFVAIAAQAIYGESFEASPGNPNNIVDIANKVKEIEQRFSFALYAADHSFQAALLSGLGLEDSTAKSNEKYLYKVFVNVSPQVLKIDSAVVFIGLKDRTELPQPRDLFGVFANKVVSLKWPVTFLNTTYVSYIIERSDDDGKTFKSISDHPFVNTDQNDLEAKFFTKSDSLPENDKIYHYRVRGQTSFGEVGPPSEAIKGSGIQKLLCEVGITKGLEISNSKIKLNWSMKCEAKIEVQSFEITRSTHVDGPYNLVNKMPINADASSYIDDQPLVTNYYKVSVVGKNKQRINSHPYLVQLADSIPPNMPQGLLATIDTTGIVKLSWKKNTEKDLLGYRVMRSNFESSEYSQITRSPITENTFLDTINIKTLTKTIFYKIAAEDVRHNRSVYSVAFKVVKPDIIPPVPPVIKSIRSTTEGIELSAVRSSSEDAVKHLLYRKTKKGTNWDLIKTFTGDSLYYKDNLTDAKQEYYYALTAVDDTGLQSEKSQPVVGKALNLGIKPAIKKIQYDINRESKFIKLKWDYEAEGIAKYFIYRATETEPLSLYKAIGEKENSLNDSNLVMNTTYRYRIKVIFNDGSESLFSDELTIAY